jgi:hypothetical protein
MMCGLPLTASSRILRASTTSLSRALFHQVKNLMHGEIVNEKCTTDIALTSSNLIRLNDRCNNMSAAYTPLWVDHLK